MKKVSKKTLLLWRLRLTLLMLPLVAITLVALKPLPILQKATSLLILFAFFFLFFVYLPLGYKNFSYHRSTTALIIKSGVVYHSEKSIPLSNIQYIYYASSPLERFLKLKTAVVLTAGSTTRIVGLDKHDDI